MSEDSRPPERPHGRGGEVDEPVGPEDVRARRPDVRQEEGLRQEEDRVSGRWAVGLTLAFLAVVVGGGWWAWALLPEGEDPIGGEVRLRMPEGGARLEHGLIGGGRRTAPGTLPARQSEDDAGYGWVDPAGGVVRIPIEEAMEVVAGESGSGDRATRGGDGDVPGDGPDRDTGDAPDEGPEAEPGTDPETPPRDRVDVEERPGALLPADLRFRDEDGRSTSLGDLLRPERPLLLVLGWYRCRTLCGTLLDGAVDAAASLPPGAEGVEPPLLAMVSVDPREGPGDAGARRARLREEGLRPPPGGLRLLVGEKDEAERLADALGYRYAWDGSTDQYAHPAVLVVVTPGGRVSRYLYGVRFPSDELAAAVGEAAEGRSRSSLEQVVMRCFRYVPALRRHAGLVANVLRGGGVLVLLGLGGVFVVAGRRASRREEAR